VATRSRRSCGLVSRHTADMFKPLSSSTSKGMKALSVLRISNGNEGL
jgi:hypothetical protein